jgi:hypothetical protein
MKSKTQTMNTPSQDNPETQARKYLADRGVSWETFLHFGGEVTSGLAVDEISKRLNRNFTKVRRDQRWDKVKAIFWVPTHNAEGKQINWFCRPWPDFAGQKFLNPSERPAPMWIPSETWAVAEDTSVPITVTEGPVKGLVLAQAGAHPIALSGVYNLAEPKKREAQGVPENDDNDDQPEQVDENAKLRLRNELLPPSFIWLNRKVYLCFDMDSRTKPEVRRAEIRAWLLFEAQGAQVFKLEWPA